MKGSSGKDGETRKRRATMAFQDDDLRQQQSDVDSESEELSTMAAKILRKDDTGEDSDEDLFRPRDLQYLETDEEALVDVSADADDEPPKLRKNGRTWKKWKLVEFE